MLYYKDYNNLYTKLDMREVYYKIRIKEGNK
jgi:hypothetical protein